VTGSSGSRTVRRRRRSATAVRVSCRAAPAASEPRPRPAAREAPSRQGRGPRGATRAGEGCVRRPRWLVPAPAMRSGAYLLRRRDEADEAVQDTFVKVFTHITSYARTCRSRRGSPDPRQHLRAGRSEAAAGSDGDNRVRTRDQTARLLTWPRRRAGSMRTPLLGSERRRS